MDWQFGDRLADWSRIDFGIGNGLAMDGRIGDGLA